MLHQFTMSKPQPQPIGIVEFIQQVRKEIFEAQQKAQKPLLQLDTIELEIKFVTEKEAKGGINLYVASIGGKYSNEKTHAVKLKLSPYAPTPQTVIGPAGRVLPASPPTTIVVKNTGPGQTGEAKS